MSPTGPTRNLSGGEPRTSTPQFAATCFDAGLPCDLVYRVPRRPAPTTQRTCMSQPPATRPINRIVLLSLDSLYSGLALPLLADHFQGRIVGICLSRRFGGKYGSLWTQIKRNYSRSGLDFLVYLSLQLFLFFPMSYVAGGANPPLGRRH